MYWQIKTLVHTFTTTACLWTSICAWHKHAHSHMRLSALNSFTHMLLIGTYDSNLTVWRSRSAQLEFMSDWKKTLGSSLLAGSRKFPLGSYLWSSHYWMHINFCMLLHCFCFLFFVFFNRRIFQNLHPALDTFNGRSFVGLNTDSFTCAL